jgi:hypothetical protein
LCKIEKSFKFFLPAKKDRLKRQALKMDEWKNQPNKRVRVREPPTDKAPGEKPKVEKEKVEKLVLEKSVMDSDDEIFYDLYSDNESETECLFNAIDSE